MSQLDRREALRLAGAAGVVALGTGCEPALTQAYKKGRGIPATLAPPESTDSDPVFHLLSRAGFGPRPGDIATVKAMGAEAWIDRQLKPEAIPDKLCSRLARRFESLHMQPGSAYEFKKPVLRDEITRHTLIRAIHSERQLLEVMVGFWTDDLNISLDKEDCIYLKPHDDREVIRKHALGSFPKLIRASATSPAMLFYLDGRDNKVRPGTDDKPNENYARELLELHTMGAGRGYTQQDVLEAARCLSGWRLVTKGFRKGRVHFDPDLHDDGEKTVLGETIPAGGGEKDTDLLIEIVCARPETARYVSEKLCRSLVAPDPPEALVAATAKSFSESGGDIAKTLRGLLTHELFYSQPASLLKRPVRLVSSSIRLLGGQTHVKPELIRHLERMGQSPFQYPTPDGYPVEGLPWMGTLLWRWNFGFQLPAGRVKGTSGDLDALVGALANGAGREGDETSPVDVFGHLCGRLPLPEELAALEEFDAEIAAIGDTGPKVRRASMLGLALSTPAFQRY